MSGGWRPIVTDEEWQAHQAAQWATKTDEQIASVGSSGWDLNAEQQIRSISFLPVDPEPDPNTIAAPLAWHQRAEQQIQSLSDQASSTGTAQDAGMLNDAWQSYSPPPAVRDVPPWEREEPTHRTSGLYDAPATSTIQAPTNTTAQMGMRTYEPPPVLDAQLAAPYQDYGQQGATAGIHAPVQRLQSEDGPPGDLFTDFAAAGEQQRQEGIAEQTEVARRFGISAPERYGELANQLYSNLDVPPMAAMRGVSAAARAARFRTPPPRTAEEIAQAAADHEANGRIWSALSELPGDVERRLGGHLFMGGGVRALNAMKAALSEMGAAVPQSLESGSASIRLATDLSGASIGAGVGYATAGENATQEERLLRAGAGALGGLALAEGGRGLVTGLRNAKPGAASVAAIEGAPVTDASGRLLSGSERLAAGGQLVLPAPKLSSAGEKTRQGLIDTEATRLVTGGMAPSDAMKRAGETIDAYITALQRKQAIPPDMLQGETRNAALRASDTLGTYARLNMLLSPLTHIRNIAGTSATIPWQFAEGFVAPAIEPIWLAMGKTGESRYLGEVPARAAGMAHAWVAAGQNLLSTLRYGDDAIEMAQTGRVARQGVDRALAVGFRPLSAMDAFFKTIYEGGELYAQAYRSARAAGHKGAALQQEMLRIMQSPDDDLVGAVEKAAKYHTYNSDPKKAVEVLQKISQAPILGPTLAAFVRTPVNAIKYDLERSPFGFASVVRGAADKSATSGEMADRTARALLGSAVAYGLYQHAAAGNITGPMPNSDAERDAWAQEGRKPWSVRMGDSWYSLSQLPGLGATVAIAASVADMQRRTRSGELDFGQAAGRYALHLGRVLAQKPLLDNLTQLLEAFDDPEKADGFFERMGASTITQYLPGASAGRYAENITDPIERDARGILNRLKVNYPGLAQQVPARRTAFGDEVRRTQTGVEAALNPLRRSSDMGRDAIRRYRGSDSAAQDAEIQRAIDAVQHYNSRPREYPRPTAEQQALYKQFNGRENSRWSQLRSAEASRLRRERVAG